MKDKMNFKKAIPIVAIACIVIGIAFVVLSNISQAGYYITIGKNAHGTVTADKKRAQASETVTLECTAEEGYELKEILVNGETIEGTSFEMPQKNALVEAKFAIASAKKGETAVYEGEAPGAIAYQTIYPNGETHVVSWNLVYKEDGLEATAWVEGAAQNGSGVLLNLSREKLSEKEGQYYLPDDTYQILCEYQKENGVISPKIITKRMDAEGVWQEIVATGIVASMIDWEEDGKTIGYQTTIKIKYATLGYSGKEEAKKSLVVLVGNRAEVLPNMIAEFWMAGDYDAENYLTYPRLTEDNTLQENIFADMKEMELEAYRDMGVVLDGEISSGEYIGTKLEDATENHRLTVQANLTKGKNVRLVMEIESNTAFEELVNDYPGVGQYLFAEIGLGNNDGQTCTMIKANVKGEAENALSVVKVTENGGNANYKYKAVVEMWIPKASISDNINPNIVRFSRLALFSGNKSEGGNPDNIFLVARWADINNCNIMASGIELESEVVVPEAEAKGMDGIWSEGEYKGAIIQDKSKTHQITIQGYLTDGKNIRLAVKVDANTKPDKIVNDYPTLSKYLFVEAGFGYNTGEDCKMIKANVLGQAVYAATVVKTQENAQSAEYRYSTVIEMWIPKESITNNTTPDSVPFTRMILFAENREGSKENQNLYPVAKWADINNCRVTAEGIRFGETIDVPASEKAGMDGVLSSGEYKGAILKDFSAERRVLVWGHLTEGNNIRVAMKIQTKTAPDQVVNSYPGLSQSLFAEMRFGNNSGEDGTMIKANLLGDVEKAATVVKTTDNGASAEYRYTTIVEMWVPKSSISSNTTPDDVPLTRLALFSEDTGAFMVARWVDMNNCRVTANGIRLEGQPEVPANEKTGFDGIISAGEYKGATIEGTSANYKFSMKGFLTEGKNIRLGIEIESKYAPEKGMNSYPGLGEYLFSEFGFGSNTGENCTLVQANVLGEASNATTVVRTVENEKGAQYPYKTVIEMWIPQSSITNNINPDKVEITRTALFHGLDAEDPNANWVVAKWAKINRCSLTAYGIVLRSQDGVLGPQLTAPENEAIGLDGVISEDEYTGATIRSFSDERKVTVQGYLTEEKNIRLAMKIESKTAPDQIVNDHPGLAEYLFSEMAFGDISGDGDYTLIRANVLGKAENAASAVKTTDNGEGAVYRYTTVVEMWVPQDSITNNTNPDKVSIARIALFSGNDGIDSTPNNTFLVAKWASINEDYSLTAKGIKSESQLEVPESEATGFDGVISAQEYQGETIVGASKNYRISIQGYLTEGKNIRLGLVVDSKHAPEKELQEYAGVGKYLFTEFGFGNNTGEDCLLVQANVLGDALNAATIAKTTENGAGAQYAYTTVIEMWIPQTAITNNTNPDKVPITRAALFHKWDEEDSATNWLVAKWAGINECSITKKGITLKSQDIPTNESAGIDGILSSNEYKGTAIETTSTNYKFSMKGYLTEGKNIRLGITIESKHAPETVLNEYPGLSQYLFAEFGFGNNTGEDCTLVKANLLGDTENAISVVNTIDNGEGTQYRYKTVIEMWVSKDSITNNTTPNMVQITRTAMFHKLDGEDASTNWIVAKWAGINGCYVTEYGIVKADLLAGMDGVIAENEYLNSRTDLTTTTLSWLQFDARVSLKGYLQGEGIGSHTVRLAIQIDSNTAPEVDINTDSALFSTKRYFELSLGNNNGDLATPYTPILADVVGNAENAVSVVKTTDNGESAEYRYTTVIELWVPQSGISNDTNIDLVHLPRFKYYANNEEKWIAQTPGNFGWAYVQADGIK